MFVSASVGTTQWVSTYLTTCSPREASVCVVVVGWGVGARWWCRKPSTRRRTACRPFELRRDVIHSCLLRNYCVVFSWLLRFFVAVAVVLFAAATQQHSSCLFWVRSIYCSWTATTMGRALRGFFCAWLANEKYVTWCIVLECWEYRFVCERRAKTMETSNCATVTKFVWFYRADSRTLLHMLQICSGCNTDLIDR